MTDAVDLHSRIAAAFDARYATSPMFKERLAVWQEMILAAEGNDGDVLDAGCGSGVFSIAAAQRARSILAFDGSEKMIEIAIANARRADARIDFRCARLGDPGLIAGRRFDLILCSSVLEYVDDWWTSFDWLASALAPRGTLIFSMPNGASLYRMFEAASYRLTGRPAYFAHVRNVPRVEDVLDGLGKRGFAARTVRYYGAPPLVAPLVRAAGLRRRADSLFAISCQRTSQGSLSGT